MQQRSPPQTLSSKFETNFKLFSISLSALAPQVPSKLILDSMFIIVFVKDYYTGDLEGCADEYSSRSITICIDEFIGYQRFSFRFTDS